METRTRLVLRVSPGAGRSGVVGRRGPAWHVRVAAAPERGRANDAVVRLLADTLGLRRGQIEIVSGSTAREKVVALDGIAPDELERRLASATAGAGKDKA